MKLVVPIENITDIQSHAFNIIVRKDEVISYKYLQKTPYSLLILVDFSNNELVLEFTGKILLDHYAQLINRDNIGECIDNINDLRICKLDRGSIIRDAKVVKCDVTMDVEADINQISTTIKQNLVNYSKWNIKPYNYGIAVENVVSTPKYKKRIAIYDKGKELSQGNSKHFINQLSNGDEILDYYKGKVRFEANLNTMYQIRQKLNIPDNNLQTILNSTANPILSLIDEAVKFKEPKVSVDSLRNYEHLLLLKECDFDLAKVEAKVRAFNKKTTSITKAMQPYKNIYHQQKSQQDVVLDIRKLVSDNIQK